MAFEILSLIKIERKFEYEPNYRAVIRYKDREVPCDIYTTLRFFDGGRIICDFLYRTSFNGNLCFKLEITNPFMLHLEKELQDELIDFIRNQDKFKNRKN